MNKASCNNPVCISTGADVPQSDMIVALFELLSELACFPRRRKVAAVGRFTPAYCACATRKATRYGDAAARTCGALIINALVKPPKVFPRAHRIWSASRWKTCVNQLENRTAGWMPRRCQTIGFFAVGKERFDPLR